MKEAICDYSSAAKPVWWTQRKSPHLSFGPWVAVRQDQGWCTTYLHLSRERGVLRRALEALRHLYRLEQTEKMSKKIWEKIFTEAPSAEWQKFQFCPCVICVSGWTNAWHGFSLLPQKGFFCSGYKFWGVNRCTLLPEMRQVTTTSSSSLKSTEL